MENKLIYNVEDKPKFSKMIVFAFQQVLAVLAATIAVPCIIGLPVLPVRYKVSLTRECINCKNINNISLDSTDQTVCYFCDNPIGIFKCINCNETTNPDKKISSTCYSIITNGWHSSSYERYYW